MTRKQKISLAVIVILHAVGVVGLSLPKFRDLFVMLTPVNLLISAVLIFIHHKFRPAHGWFFFFVYAVGYGVELAGVQSGAIFGEYSYGPAFGFQLGGTPLLIGLNWLLLVYGSALWAKKVTDKKGLRAIIAAVFMVALDYLIEPVAVALNFWTWEGGSIPIQNFVAWFAVALVLQAVLHFRMKFQDNPVGRWFFVVQVGFFAMMLWLV